MQLSIFWNINYIGLNVFLKQWICIDRTLDLKFNPIDSSHFENNFKRTINCLDSWQDSSKRVGNPKTSRKESDVAVALARPLHVSKVGQIKEKGKTKQATHVSGFHAYGSKSCLWPRRGFTIRLKRLQPRAPTLGGSKISGVRTISSIFVSNYICNKYYGQSKRYNWHLANVSITTVIIFCA